MPGRIRVWVVLAAACLAAVACAPRPAPVETEQIVTVGVVAPREAGPSVGLRYLTTALAGETLVSIGPTGEIVPRLIERWERSADGRTWKFYLKKGVHFHDGSPLTSSRILPALERQLPLLNGARSVRMIDEGTFEIVQDQASALLLDGLIEVPVATGADNRAGTGPFVPTETQGELTGFRAFDGYHRGKPSLSGVGLQQYPDQRRAWAALMRAEIDVLYEVSAEARDFVETESTINVSAFLRPYTYLLVFNLAADTFKGREVRQALNLAVDREKVIRTALRGHGQPAFDHLWPRHWAVDPSRSAYRPDKAAAVRLLERAGKTRLKPGREGRMPSRLSFHCLVYAPLEKFALAIQRELALVDVDMTVELLPVAQMGRRIGTGDYEAFLFELTNVRSIGFTYAFWHSQSPRSVRTGYSAADAALDQMRLARTDEEIKAGVRAVQDVMRADPPAIFIAYPEVARAVRRRFHIPGAEEDIFHTIARWTLAPEGD